MKILREPEEWAQGAIGLPMEELSHGVLFVLPHLAHWPVTMAHVRIPLDVYWLGAGGMVLHRMTLLPGMDPYWPDQPATYILELPMREEPAYTVGDFVEVPP